MSQPSGAQPIPEAEDESLRKWREAILRNADAPEANPKDDPRRVIIKEFRVIVTNGPTYTFDLTTPQGLEKAKSEPYILKEGCTFHYELKFCVHHELAIGLKMRVKSRKMIGSNEEVFDIGSYPQSPEDLTKVMIDCEVPVGFMSRGKYSVTNTIENNNGEAVFQFDSKFEIVKA